VKVMVVDVRVSAEEMLIADAETIENVTMAWLAASLLGVGTLISTDSPSLREGEIHLNEPRRHSKLLQTLHLAALGLALWVRSLHEQKTPRSREARTQVINPAPMASATGLHVRS
jgi:hypothetical protein